MAARRRAATQAARLAALLFVALAVGCARLPANALAVPAVRQQAGYSCGPAALVAVLRYWQKPVACEQDLYSSLHTTAKDGTEPFMLAEVAQQHGLQAQLRTGVTVDELRAALADGTTVILDLQAWQAERRPWATDWDDGHYVVLVALDGERAYAMDPSSDRGYAWLPVGELVERWHDFEDRDGTRHEFVHAGVFIRGQQHAHARLGRPERME